MSEASVNETTPLTDANEVDLNECLSVQTHSDGRRSYVEKYVPSHIARRLESALAGAESALDRLHTCCNLLLSRKPVRDVSETLAEVKAALAQIEELRK